MSIQALRLSILMLLLAATGVAHAADAVPTATDADKSYLALRNSKDRKTQLLAERWYSLVQLQEWSDASGKFKTKAKYVEQDDKLGTVKLRVITGAGKDQIVKDRTISIDKLSKECQSRVKQIAFLAEKVDEAAKAEAEKTSKPKEGADAMPGMAGPPDARVGGMTPLGADPAPGERGARATRAKPDRAGAKDRAKGATGSEEKPKEDAAAYMRGPQQTPPAEEAATPLPAALPSVPVATTAAADPRPSSAPGAAGELPARDPRSGARTVEPANLPDQQPWRTSFDVFRAQFKAEHSYAGWQLSWGELGPLHQAHDYAVPPEPGKRMPPAPTVESLGEFAWEMPLGVQPDEQTDWTKALGLTLPEPFQLIATLDGERGPGEWHRFFPGDRVKFVGRFVGFEGDGGMRIAIRFPDDVQAPIPVRSAMPPQ